MKTWKYALVLSGMCVSFLACGGGVETNEDGNPTPPSDYIKLNAFSLGSEYPADIVIPNLPSMSRTAFIATDGLALGVVPIDLETLQVSTIFEGLDATPNEIASVLSYARDLEILSPDLALFLGGTGMVSFNPSSGEVHQTLAFDQEIQLDDPIELSRMVDGQDTVSGSFLPSSADHVAIIGDQVFVTMSNLFFDIEFKTYYVQGMLLSFDLQNGQLSPANPSYKILPGFNSTGLTVYQNQLFVTLTGATEFTGDGQVPLTDSKIVKINPNDLNIEGEINLGKVAATYSSLAITAQGRAFIGSAAFSEVYEVDLNQMQVIRGETNPLVLSDKAGDYITDQEIHPTGDRLFVASFNNNFVRAFDLSDPNYPLEETIWNFDLEANPGLTGAGPMAFRPGTQGVDFTGHDLMVLTANPGTLSTALTVF